MEKTLEWYEFFAGGGMARLGLGEKWKCLFANEISEKKASSYTARFGAEHAGQIGELRVADIASLTAADLPAHACLAWASFPCQDLSLAGLGGGLGGHRSGTFNEFWRLIVALRQEGRAPNLVVLENVLGAITSRQGKDFQQLIRCLHDAGYVVGPVVVDAKYFVPQSRPRLFIVAVDRSVPIPETIESPEPNHLWHPAGLRSAFSSLPSPLQASWKWWDLPRPDARRLKLSNVVDVDAADVVWHTAEQTRRLLRQMSASNIAKVEKAMRLGVFIVGSAYRRTRPDEQGQPVQRAEVRFDEIAGCLRTPAGGSSRQIVLVVEGRNVRSRLLSAREAARLMGVDPSEYPIPANYNEAYHLFGDGVVVPVVRFLERHLLRPLANAEAIRQAA